jgi:hypothetical protein
MHPSAGRLPGGPAFDIPGRNNLRLGLSLVNRFFGMSAFDQGGIGLDCGRVNL